MSDDQNYLNINHKIGLQKALSHTAIGEIVKRQANQGDINNMTTDNVPNNYKLSVDFQKLHPTKSSKEKALKSMTNAQIDQLISACPNVQAKIFYASFRKN